ncbi:MAG: endopeptidase La [Deltaproteobacteria bacterium]|nr:endopeptidase La [Deltaproteobacteria bacterium]MBW2019712.1 endopeptidase La [Deltaproteobacteria bacterium]MBW2074521.1 endopeptidase La [Deltaproteobacteria bacterium]RLB81798.1 MAG: endopeptidase La [Deltaproteobacteria bacterium]
MFNITKLKKPTSDSEQKLSLPLLPLRDVVVFPHMVVPLFVGRSKSVNALSNAMNLDKNILLATQKNAGIDSPGEKDMYAVGTIGTVLQLLRLPDGTVKALVEGKKRARITRFSDKEKYILVEIEPITEPEVTQMESEAVNRTVVEMFEQYAKINKNISKDLINNISAIGDVSQLADTVAAHFNFKIQDKQQLLETVPPMERMTLLFRLMQAEVEIYKMEQSIKNRVKKQMEKTQRDYYLTEQMRAIQKEMGTKDDYKSELSELESRIKRKRMSKEAAAKARQEFKKLKLMAPMSAEGTVVRNYIEWLINVPWFERSKLQTDIEKAEAILEEDHYGLEKPKERILEYLAVQKLVRKMRGPILCFVGPPGVGKTSLAKSVARATGRVFVRLSLGGVRDEAEIRGHRRTYIGAMPGKIIQSLKKAKVNNPVFCLDEVDKMSVDFRGDPSAALLEVLDPEQNFAFNDHYLDVDYDLSEILFITTANNLHGIPLPLQDRMEIIRLPGYTEYDKLQIAKDFLVPKQTEMNGLSKENIQFTKMAIQMIIRHYTREAGVRNLEREIASICRKVAREVAKDEGKKHIKITGQSVQKYLGVPRFRYGQVEEQDEIGLATGMAWTHVGGELLAIETVVMPGKGKLTVTGKLGEVMQESAKAALSYVRSRAERLGLKKHFYRSIDIHVHIPEGATPKDGPSAGITMATSIVSALIKRPVRRDLAMTGEITLRGRILPIGGLKEKILAAHRGGISQVIVPDENSKDLKEIPAKILKQIEVIPASHMDEVLSRAIILPQGETLFKEQQDEVIPPELIPKQEEAIRPPLQVN